MQRYKTQANEMLFYGFIEVLLGVFTGASLVRQRYNGYCPKSSNRLVGLVKFLFQLDDKVVLILLFVKTDCLPFFYACGNPYFCSQITSKYEL